MSRFIRWKGLVGFFVVIALIMTFIYFFADALVKKGIEKSGEWYLGAEVNVENVEIMYAPLTLNIEGFQATDPEKPTYNLVSFSQASAGVDVWQYLFGKLYISDLTVAELRIDQPRLSAGQVFTLIDQNVENGNKGADNSVLPGLDVSLPAVDELLNNSDLLTVKQGKVLEQSYQTEKKKLQGIYETLPNKDTLADYKKQVEALTNIKINSLADLEKLNKDFTALKAQFDADQAIVKQAKEQVSTSKALLTKQTQALKEAPSADWKIIESKYQLDSVEGADFAHMLFGEQAREYFGYADAVYQKIAPLIKSSKVDKQAEKTTSEGRYIHFNDDTPLPDVLIEQAKFSLILPQGEFAISGKELTHQHWVRGNNSVVNVESDNVQGSGKLALALDFSLDKQRILSGNGIWKLSDVDLNAVSLQESSAFTLQLDSGLLSGKGTFSLLDDQLDSENSLSLDNTQYSGAGTSHLSTLFIDTVQSLKTLSLTITAKGKMTAPKLSISSPLDKQLKNSMVKQVSNKLTSFKTDVKAGLNTKLSKALGMSNDEAQSLVDVEALISQTDQALDNLINSDVVKAKKKEFEDKQKKKLEDKVKKKLGKLFG
ncbi:MULTISPECIES: TIGR03545 family protein [unclassified Colwellia]|uniref:TIGR03545 family protein n=1 Tax=unclassified Colwellia TaxID=196834 RepID=UPI0015F46F9E|nr:MULTISPECIES: TIGR03545 family protein [unclassified Colwellia]MBA6233372.1 TIGR03545 family protein [Colwellia sp. MB02u-7]MBA6236462.1 TIGR03545 family protein [Colwellia sp. MB02u-11]MBA6256996.1 TIGR03545 family protein [Colwellia sp. MB3u-28]MBA6260999.1 TIGR03545 family protein [Colwellia sp. MB3u-41]MBA6298139.1 TIGR03545 family protein [Colwellia sp. MB3u-22]